MPRNTEHLDEYILAAYLSGKLPAGLKREIVAYLADNDDARDLLAMADEAMNAAESGDGASISVAERTSTPTIARKLLAVAKEKEQREHLKMDSTPQSGPVPAEETNVWKVIALLAAALLILAVVLSYHLFLGTD